MAQDILIITGAVIAIGKMQSGVAEKTGNEWSSQEIIIKPEGKYAKPAWQPRGHAGRVYWKWLRFF